MLQIGGETRQETMIQNRGSICFSSLITSLLLAQVLMLASVKLVRGEDNRLVKLTSPSQSQWKLNRVQVADMFFVVLDFVLVGRCFKQLLSSCHP